jgi:glycosyltransferase involved in cell wall biosynthesis
MVGCPGSSGGEGVLRSVTLESQVVAADARSRIGVVHVVDTLNLGGAEHVAVNLANHLPRDRFAPYLCTTRTEGPLSSSISPHVGRLKLERRGRLDLVAVRRFVQFLEAHDVRIIHAHASSLFFCRLAAAFSRRCSLIWHDHYGLCDCNDRPAWLYRLATRRVDGVIAVNQRLSNWCRNDLGLSAAQVWYIPNLVEDRKAPPPGRALELPGTAGKRVVCVANFRPQKDHATLLRAAALLEKAGCGAHLFLVGDSAEPEYLRGIQALVTSLGLDHAVTYLGPRQDVAAILEACDIGVLSSASEGLPLALLEYGRAGLASVATAVGQCSEVLRNGEAGLLVPPGSPVELSRAILSLLTDDDLRRSLGRSFRDHVEEHYSARRVMRQICAVYEIILGRTE